MSPERLAKSGTTLEMSNIQTEVRQAINMLPLPNLGSKLNIFLRYLHATGTSYSSLTQLFGSTLRTSTIQSRVAQSRAEHGQEWRELLEILGLNRNQRAKLRDVEISELRAEGKTQEEIAQILSVPYSSVGKSIARQLRRGAIRRFKPDPTTVAGRDALVEVLRGGKDTNPEITKKIGAKNHEVETSAKRLIRKGKIKPRRVPGQTEAKVRRYLRRFQNNHPGQPVNLAQVARDLKIKHRNYVHKHYHTIAQQEKVPPLERSGRKTKSQS